MEASSPGGSSSDDALRRLEERLDRASDAADRLMAEAAQAARGRAQEAGTPEAPGADARSEPPPAGWQIPGSGGDRDTTSELELLAQVVQAVRDLIPAELERRLLEALRELLLAIRAVIDWYLERSEQRRSAPSEVQDIPIS